MLRDFETKKHETNDVLSDEIKKLESQLLGQQQLLMKEKMPVIVLIEGWAAAGKGTLIKELISELDPRFYNVVSPVVLPEADERFPFLYQYMKAIPVNGKVTFLDSGWMENVVRKYLRHEITKEEYRSRVRQVNEFIAIFRAEHVGEDLSEKRNGAFNPVNSSTTNLAQEMRERWFETKDGRCFFGIVRF